MTAQRGDFDAPPPAASSVPGLRDKLASALVSWWSREAGEPVEHLDAARESAEQYAAALAPTVQAAIDDAVTAELEAAAEVIEADDDPGFEAAPDYWAGLGYAADALRARVAARNGGTR